MFNLLMLMAGANYSTFMTGNDLLSYCRANRPACIQYVEGASDMINGFQALNATPTAICEAPDVTGDQLADLTIKFLADHPESLTKGAGGLIWSALYAEFPCPS